jgi:hypothetical protein
MNASTVPLFGIATSDCKVKPAGKIGTRVATTKHFNAHSVMAEWSVLCNPVCNSCSITFPSVTTLPLMNNSETDDFDIGSLSSSINLSRLTQKFFLAAEAKVKRSKE